MMNAKEAANLTAQNIKHISLEEIETKIKEQAQDGKDYCWIQGPVLADHQRTLIENGYIVAKDGRDYRVSW